jgi:hypothetical protein
VPFDAKPVVRPYEAFVYGNAADEPDKLAERCLEVIESTLKSVERVTACLRAAELEHGIGIAAMTRTEIADAAEWHRAKLQGLLAVKLRRTGCGDLQLVEDLHLVVRIKPRLTTAPIPAVPVFFSKGDLVHPMPNDQTD